MYRLMDPMNTSKASLLYLVNRDDPDGPDGLDKKRRRGYEPRLPAWMAGVHTHPRRVTNAILKAPEI